MIRILYTTDSLRPGGAETVLARLIARLDRRRFRPVVWAKSLQGELLEELRAGGVPCADAGDALRWIGRLRGQVALRRAAAELKRQQIGLIHSFMYAGYDSEPRLARMVGVPFIVRLGNAGALRDSEVVGRRLAGADAIVSVCRRGAEAYCAAPTLRDKCFVIHNGVDLARFRPGREADGELKRSLGLDAGDCLFVCVANFRPEKDHPTLLRAMSLLGSPAGKRAGLLLAGRGDAAEDLRAQAEALGLAGRVRLTETSDVPALLQGCDVFVLPSLSEGCPNALLEAMASGLPSVVADSFGAEFLTDGSEGLIVPVGRPDALAGAMDRMASDQALRAASGQAARRLAEQRYDLDRVVRRYEEVYDRLVAADAGSARASMEVS